MLGKMGQPVTVRVRTTTVSKLGLPQAVAARMGEPALAFHAKIAALVCGGTRGGIDAKGKTHT